MAALHSQPPFDTAVHERSFGLWRADGTAKPAVDEVQARRDRTVVAPSEPGDWLDVTPDELASDRRAELARLYARYRAFRASVAPPAPATTPARPPR